MSSVSSAFSVVVRAAVCLLLLTAPPSLAQGALSDLIGTYPLRVAKAGSLCPPDTTGTFAVTSVAPGTMGISLNGTSKTVPFDAGTRTFRFAEEMPNNMGTVSMDGAFVRGPSAVTLVLDIVYPASWNCNLELTGFKAARELTAQPATPVPAGSEETSGPPTSPADTVPGPTTIGAPEPLTVEEAEENQNFLEALLAGEDEWLILIIVFVLLMLIGLGIGLRARRAPPPLSVGGGKLGMLTGGVLSPAVAAARFGGFEDTLEFGEQAGKASPAASKAYEALVVAQPKGPSRETPPEEVRPSLPPEEGTPSEEPKSEPQKPKDPGPPV